MVNILVMECLVNVPSKFLGFDHLMVDKLKDMEAALCTRMEHVYVRFLHVLSLGAMLHYKYCVIPESINTTTPTEESGR